MNLQKRYLLMGGAVLAILLVATSLAATATGLVLKAQLQKYVGGWEDRLAIAVPFMLLHDDTDLRRMEQAKQRSQDEPKQPEQPTEPEKPAEPEQPTEPEKPDEPEKPQVSGVPTELPTVVPGPSTARTRAFSTMPCSSEIPVWSAPPTMQGLARRITSQTLA